MCERTDKGEAKVENKAMNIAVQRESPNHEIIRAFKITELLLCAIAGEQFGTKLHFSVICETTSSDFSQTKIFLSRFHSAELIS